MLENCQKIAACVFHLCSLVPCLLKGKKFHEIEFDAWLALEDEDQKNRLKYAINQKSVYPKIHLRACATPLLCHLV